jgi:hypothetical protein
VTLGTKGKMKIGLAGLILLITCCIGCRTSPGQTEALDIAGFWWTQPSMGMTFMYLAETNGVVSGGTYRQQDVIVKRPKVGHVTGRRKGAKLSLEFFGPDQDRATLVYEIRRHQLHSIGGIKDKRGRRVFLRPPKMSGEMEYMLQELGIGKESVPNTGFHRTR